MVGKIIREYLEGGHKKATVPGFGTFMRKDSGDIIFVDLLRKDDGLLRQLVEDYGNYSEVDAMALIDRFIFEIKHGIEKNGSAAIEGFGTMTLDDKGVYQFNYSPQAAPVRESAVQESLFAKTGSEEKPRPAAVAAKPAQEPPRKVAEQPAQRATQRPAPQSQKRKSGKRSKPDTIIIIAIVAAVIAIAIMVFGMSGSGLPFLK